jgi:Bacterial Ig-like domain
VWLLTRRLAASVTLLSLACARIEPPPGGPPDAAAPQLVRTVPDSFEVFPKFDSDVEFVFDEVISEGGSPNQGTGTGDLERLVILSPTSEVPKVRWRRDRITVRPDEGWQRDRVYRVELLPGVTDLRRNRLDSGTVVTFSTGAPAPRTRFKGVVVDWTNARPAQGALVVAVQMPDSLPYRGIADSSGHFNLGPLPAGQYVISGVLDENRNHLADPREAFDSLRVSRSDSTLELWAFVHDTSAPRVRTVTPQDSVSASVELTQPLDPKLRLQPSAVRLLLLPDSTPVRVTSILPKPLDDSLHAPGPSERDTTARDTTAARDTIAPPGPVRARARPGARRQESERLTSRPALTSVLVLRPAAPWRPGARFSVEIRGVRNVTGVTGDVVGTLVIPEPTPRDTLAPADSLRPGRDTIRTGRDSVPAKPAPAKPAPAKPAPAKPPAKPGPTKPAPAKPKPTLPQ